MILYILPTRWFTCGSEARHLLCLLKNRITASSESRQHHVNSKALPLV